MAGIHGTVMAGKMAGKDRHLDNSFVRSDCNSTSSVSYLKERGYTMSRSGGVKAHLVHNKSSDLSTV